MAQCISPYQLKTGDVVPCNKCPNCLAGRASAWSFRLFQEQKISDNSYFITLTFDTDHIPITPKGYMTLQKKPLQDYFKRLRKEMVKQSGLFQTDYTKSILPLKYYAVGEYGTHKKRPHYHIIAFNTNKAAIEQAWKLNNIPLGDIHIGDTTDASIGYTLKYISKPGQIPQHKNDDRLPEFSLMSKGLGKNYLTPQMKKWHKKDLLNRAYCALPGDKKIKMPRYYKQQIYNDLQRQKIKIHQVDKIYSKFAALPPGERMKAAEMEYNSNIEASRRKTKKRDPRQTL